MDEFLWKNHSMVSVEIFFDHFKLGQIFSSKFNIVISRNFSISSEINSFWVFKNFFQPSFNIGHLIINPIFVNCIPIFDKFWLTLENKAVFFLHWNFEEKTWFAIFFREWNKWRKCAIQFSSQKIFKYVNCKQIADMNDILPFELARKKMSDLQNQKWYSIQEIFSKHLWYYWKWLRLQWWKT